MMRLQTSISKKLIDWSITCRDEIRDDSEFQKWTSSSRPKIYSADVAVRTPNRMQWGAEMPVTLFSSECYDAIAQLNDSVRRLSEDVYHIGPGWYLLGINELENYENINATAESQHSKPAKSRKGRQPSGEKQNKRGKLSTLQIELPLVTEPAEVGMQDAFLAPPPISIDH